MKTSIAIAAAVLLLTAAQGAAAQRCDYGPNSTSPFARAQMAEMVRVAPRPGQGSIGFRYEWRDVIIQVGIRPSTLPLVGCVVVGSSAARAGLQPGDVIVSVNGRDPRVRGTFADRRVGTRWVIRIQRDQEEREVAFTIDPPAQVAD
ncbi:MAG TPA: PDZ domain-containing protein [Longimicrobium sp.]|jgi:S1-C subfamily serine protease|nr:PDZ domain-containing protein [Longimicrobium sp.]